MAESKEAQPAFDVLSHAETVAVATGEVSQRAFGVLELRRRHPEIVEHWDCHMSTGRLVHGLHLPEVSLDLSDASTFEVVKRAIIDFSDALIVTIHYGDPTYIIHSEVAMTRDTNSEPMLFGKDRDGDFNLRRWTDFVVEEAQSFSDVWGVEINESLTQLTA